MLVKILSIIAALGLVFSLVIGKIWLGTRDELTLLESSYNSLKIDFKESQEILDKNRLSSKQDEELSTANCRVLLQVRDDTDTLLDRIQQLQKRPITPNKASEVSDNNNAQEHIAYRDDKLHPDLIRVLNESYNKNKRSTNPAK